MAYDQFSVDFLLSRSPTQVEIRAPVVAIVEAKDEITR